MSLKWSHRGSLSGLRDLAMVALRLRRTTMARPLSQELSELSARAKQAEDAVAATRDKDTAMLRKREDDIKAEAERRRQAIHQNVEESRDSVAHSWTNMTNKLQSDFD